MPSVANAFPVDPRPMPQAAARGQGGDTFSGMVEGVAPTGQLQEEIAPASADAGETPAGFDSQSGSSECSAGFGPFDWAQGSSCGGQAHAPAQAGIDASAGEANYVLALVTGENATDDAEQSAQTIAKTTAKDTAPAASTATMLQTSPETTGNPEAAAFATLEAAAEPSLDADGIPADATPKAAEGSAPGGSGAQPGGETDIARLATVPNNIPAAAASAEVAAAVPFGISATPIEADAASIAAGSATNEPAPANTTETGIALLALQAVPAQAASHAKDSTNNPAPLAAGFEPKPVAPAITPVIASAASATSALPAATPAASSAPVESAPAGAGPVAMADSIEAPALETTLARAATANAATANPSDNSAGLRPKPNVPAPQPEPSAQSLQAPAKVQGQPQSVEIAKSAEAPAPSIDQPAARNPANPSAPPTILPEPVRALAASLNPASLHARTGVESNPVPLTGLALAVEIVSRLREGLRRFDIRLDPPELGRIDVRLDVDRHGHATTRMTVDRPETLDLLQREARGLERALQQAGLKTEDGALEFSLRYQAQDGASDRQPHRFAEERTGMLAVDDSELVMAAGLQRYALAAHARGGIDIRV